LTRAFAADLQCREDADGRTVYGMCVPFDAPTPIREGGNRFTETFTRGSFARTIAERGDRVKLLVSHDHRALPIGRAVSLREDAAGLVGEFRVSRTRAGDEALQLVTDGALDSFSIGFEPVRSDWSKDGQTVVRREAKLREVSLVNFPAYEGALVAGVRDAIPFLSTERALAQLRYITRR
jgi:HK97 family phage prohead protease